jgi:hypothetical protein
MAHCHHRENILIHILRIFSFILLRKMETTGGISPAQVKYFLMFTHYALPEGREKTGEGRKHLTATGTAHRALPVCPVVSCPVKDGRTE